MAHTNGPSMWGTPRMVLSKFDMDANEPLDRKEFRTLCIKLFGPREIEEHEEKVDEIFGFFDVDADGTLNEQEFHKCYKWLRATIYPVNVLLVVDVQNDFISGSMSIRNGAEVLEPINRILTNGHWDKVIYTQDWHPENHISFSENLALRDLHPDFKATQGAAEICCGDTVVFLQPHVKQRLFTKHCVMNTWGAELHKDLVILPSSDRVYKGQDPDKDMFSPFDNKDADSTVYSTDLNKMLMDIGATHIYVCGLTYDICVKDTCLNGLSLGYRLALIDDCCRAAFPHDVPTVKKLISENGGLVICSDRVLSLVNEGKRSLIMAYHAAKVESYRHRLLAGNNRGGRCGCAARKKLRSVRGISAGYFSRFSMWAVAQLKFTDRKLKGNWRWATGVKASGLSFYSSFRVSPRRIWMWKLRENDYVLSPLFRFHISSLKYLFVMFLKLSWIRTGIKLSQ